MPDKPYKTYPVETDYPAINRVFKALDRQFVRGPIGRSWWMGYGYVALKLLKGRLILSNIWVEHRFRGKGHARTMLMYLLHLADMQKVEVRAWPKSFDKNGNHLTTPQLKNWYKSFGFQEVKNSDFLERPYGQKIEESTQVSIQANFPTIAGADGSRKRGPK